MSMRSFAAAAALIVAACGTPPPPAPAPVAAAPAPSPSPSPPPRAQPMDVRAMNFAEVGELFRSRGVQPGQPLPALSLVDASGQPADVVSLRAGRPLVLVTCSLTCNVARRQQAAVADLAKRWGDRAAFVMVYTIDAHPQTDACPYTGAEWVPPANANDGVLVRQPASLDERQALARRYAKDWPSGAVMLVDGMDDAAWRWLGQAPNAGIVVGADGVVVERCGWFDAAKVEAALSRLLP